LALASDGSLYVYSQAAAGPKAIILPKPAKKIAGVGAAAFVVETSDDLLAWGYLANYLGLKSVKSPTSIKNQWVKAGCKFPSKELIGNYNTLHIIDSEDNLFGAGENVQGEVGNGEEWANWNSYKPGPYAWNWEHGQLISKPVQIPGKFKNLCTNNSLVFYFYVQDLGGNWYSWGRNKGRCLGNGLTLRIDDEAIYPNALDVPAPQLVTPLTAKWRVLGKFNPNSPREPISNAGVYQYITTDYTVLNGSGSSQQNGKLVKYSWTKVTGPDCNLVDSLQKLVKVTGLINGKYVFRLTVTNSSGKSDSAEVEIHVRK
jgi:hypothetical protein